MLIMMNKLKKATEVTENDNLVSALGKGVIEGAVKGFVTYGAVGLGLVLAARSYKAVTDKKEEA
jgi:hypothetical protein